METLLSSFARAVCGVSILVLLHGCGGGSGSTGSEAKSQPSAANPFVITNDSPNVTTEGNFNATDGYLSRSKKLLVSANGDASATFHLKVETKGFYKAFIWSSQVSANLQSPANVSVRGNGSEHKSVLEPSQDIGRWKLIGLFEFDPAGNNDIQIASANKGPLTIDAIRVEFMGAERPQLQFEVVSTSGNPNAVPALHSPQLGRAYEADIPVIGGTLPYRFTVESGLLPSGLILDARSGKISGVANGLSKNDVSISVADSAGARIEAKLTMTVSEKSADTPAVAVLPPSKAKPLDGNPVGTPPNLSNLVTILRGVPEGSWVKVNLNAFSSVWAPKELTPLTAGAPNDQRKIIEAWGSFAWDPNRGDLWLYGGGHANYTGNDVYRWHGTTQLWERASLPSEVNQDDLGLWKAIDGQDAAPGSAHTYDNNMFLPILDRMLVWGGAAYNNGGFFMKQTGPTTSRPVGPYLFNPNRADANKVGGTTGSHVQRVTAHPEVVGGNMWQNRDMWVNAQQFVAGTVSPPTTFVNGCTGYAVENGKDVVYVGAPNGGDKTELYRYVINDVSNPTLDSFTRVGVYQISQPGDQPSCAYDPVQKIFFKKLSWSTYSFDYWNLNTPGVVGGQVKVTVVDPTGEFQNLLDTGSLQLYKCGMDFDPVRRKYGLWCYDGRVWMITPPAVLGPTGWTIQKQVTPSGTTPLETVAAGGVLGKWKYIPNIDAFMGLASITEGQIWLYKPVGWTLGGGSPPPPPPPTEIIVDNAGAGILDSAGGRTFTGSWCTSSGPSPYGSDSNYSCGNAGANTYRWTPNIPTAGSYDVYVRWTEYPTRSSSVPISVSSSSGIVSKSFNETTGGGAWVLHGRYSFAAGKVGYAEVNDSTGQANADAVRFVPAAGSPPPPPPPIEIIVDNAPQGVSDTAGGRTFTGTWCTSSGASPYGADSIYSCGSAINTYRWTPTISTAGDYDVYVRWTTYPTRSATVPISVTSTGGTVSRTFNETSGGSVWVLHGRYNFAAGTTGYVSVSSSNGQANADAVRLVQVLP